MRLLFIILSLLISVSVQAQLPFIKDVYLNETNTPIKVNDFLQDKRGYMWLATDVGVYRFNGREVIHIEDSVQVPATSLTVFQGKVWVGFNNGKLGSIDGARVNSIKIGNTLPSSPITSLYSIDSKILWVGTEGNGVFAVVNNLGIACDNHNGLSDNFVYCTVALPGKSLLAATDKGINILSLNGKNVSIKAITTANGLPDNIVRVIKPIPERPWYWVGMQQGGVALFNKDNHQVWTPATSAPWTWGQVNDILPMSDNRAWVATEDGYLLEVVLRDSASMSIRPLHYDGKKLKKLVCGKSGVIWCATNVGLTMVTAEYMSYVPLHHPYSVSDMRAMTCDKKNILWYAQRNVLYKLPLKEAYKPASVLKLPAEITSLYADERGRLWIGTLGKGVWYVDENGRLVNVDYIAPLINESVLDITGTSDRLWIAGLNGVQEVFYPGDYTQKMSLFRRHNKTSGIGSDYVYQLYTDRKNRVWMATDGAGVCMFDGYQYHRWDSATGMKSKVVYSITQDGYGNMWAATLNNGLYRYDGKQWQQLAKLQGLQDVNISTVAANATGQVIVVNGKGIDVWYPRSGQFRNYDRRQGFHIDSLSSTLKLSATDKEGNVYIPFEHGLLTFRNIYEPYDIRPVVNLSSVSVFFKPVLNGQRLFSHDENHISFHFDGVNFANPERLHYRYKLEGYNDSWIVTNDESVTFPQLSTGQYKFRVQTSLNNTFSSLGEARYAFSVGSPFWKRSWFLLLMATVVLTGAYSYIRMREKNLRKVSLLQRERMMFEYEHLKSQVNPHFLFNSLNTLTNLIDEDKESAMNYTVHLSDLYRNMLAYRDKDLILLEEEWEILENYMHIQQTRFGNALRLKADVAQRLKKSKKIVPLALQLLVENAIKHNVVSMAMPLTIRIEAVEGHIIVRNRLQKKFSKEKGAGLGLINIRKRYELLTKEPIEFGIENDEYIVILPLL